MPYAGDPRGALWRRWDLHVHTPASYEHEFGDRASPQTWERYFEALRSLPAEMAVLGINDYFSVDGYRRVRGEWQAGRLPNIQLVLPVVEIRLEHLAGHSDTQRLNYHVVFSDAVSADEIERSFLSRLTVQLGEFDGSIGHAAGMAEYGRAVKGAAPPGRTPVGPDEKVGFQHAYVRLDDVDAALQRSAFRDRVLLALGYTEWDAMRWAGGGGAIKRQLAGTVDFFFGCSASPATHAGHVAKLKEARVGHQLIDASDAHRLPGGAASDRRLGDSLTWLRADPTFEGLRRALQRYEERVYCGDEPPQLARVRQQRHQLVRSIEIRKQEGSGLEESWFNSHIALNPGLVAVIGNQGSGKSALTDVLALVANADTAHYSFLNDKRFRKPGSNKARHFRATMTWEDGQAETKVLSDDRHPDRPERARYVPQQFFELATNEVEVEGGGTLYAEIERAVFSHVPPAQRQDAGTFRALVDVRTRGIDARLADLRAQLAACNADIWRLEVETASLARALVRSRIEARQQAVAALEVSPPPAVEPPTQDAAEAAALERLREEIAALSERVREAQQLETKEFTTRQALGAALAALQRVAADAARQRDEVLAGLGEAAAQVDPETLLRVTLDLTPLTSLYDQATARLRAARAVQAEEVSTSAAGQLRLLRDQLERRTAALGSAQRAYELYRTNRQAWEDHLRALREDPDDPDALEPLVAALRRLEDEVPAQLKELRATRDDLCIQIHETLEEKLDVYRDLSRHVQEFLATEDLTREQYQLQFDLALTPLNLSDLLFQILKHQGPLAGAEATRAWVREQVEATDFGSATSVLRLARGIEARILDAHGDDQARAPALQALLRTGRSTVELYDLLFGIAYVRPRYRLALRGKLLEQLSPGERGILLLIFYLIVDRSDLPLIIDQPEGNLNNQSIYEHLVPVIRRAKETRQIIMVSHNPNIVVGCDADQIVHAELDQSAGCCITYSTGALEHPRFRELTIDKLEGTRPAFRQRSEAYLE